MSIWREASSGLIIRDTSILRCDDCPCDAGCGDCGNQSCCAESTPSVTITVSEWNRDPFMSGYCPSFGDGAYAMTHFGTPGSSTGGSGLCYDSWFYTEGTMTDYIYITATILYGDFGGGVTRRISSTITGCGTSTTASGYEDQAGGGWDLCDGISGSGAWASIDWPGHDYGDWSVSISV